MASDSHYGKSMPRLNATSISEIPNYRIRVTGRISHKQPRISAQLQHRFPNEERVVSLMASRRLIDLYTIANASAAIVQKHVLIRTHQLNHYRATTSIGKTLNGRVGPRFTTPTGTAPPGTPIDGRHRVGEEGIDQDHHYTPGEGSVKHPKPENDLIINQKPTEGIPLPDGTVNPAGISAAYKDG